MGGPFTARGEPLIVPWTFPGGITRSATDGPGGGGGGPNVVPQMVRGAGGPLLGGTTCCMTDH